MCGCGGNRAAFCNLVQQVEHCSAIQLLQSSMEDYEGQLFSHSIHFSLGISFSISSLSLSQTLARGTIVSISASDEDPPLRLVPSSARLHLSHLREITSLLLIYLESQKAQMIPRSSPGRDWCLHKASPSLEWGHGEEGHCERAPSFRTGGRPRACLCQPTMSVCMRGFKALHTNDAVLAVLQ